MATETRSRAAELIRLALVVLGAILLFVGWYRYLDPRY